MRSFARLVAAGLGVFMLVFGLWAFLAPHSFFDQVATFGTYNVHLVHDVGAFQVGFGATLLLALVMNDVLTVVLLGGAVGTVLHEIAHVIDRNIGAKNTKLEPLGLGVVAVVVVAAALVTLRSRRS